MTTVARSCINVTAEICTLFGMAVFWDRFLYSGCSEAHGETLIEVGLLADKYHVEELQRAATWLNFGTGWFVSFGSCSLAGCQLFARTLHFKGSKTRPFWSSGLSSSRFASN